MFLLLYRPDKVEQELQHKHHLAGTTTCGFCRGRGASVGTAACWDQGCFGSAASGMWAPRVGRIAGFRGDFIQKRIVTEGRLAELPGGGGVCSLDRGAGRVGEPMHSAAIVPGVQFWARTPVGHPLVSPGSGAHGLPPPAPGHGGDLSLRDRSSLRPVRTLSLSVLVPGRLSGVRLRPVSRRRKGRPGGAGCLLGPHSWGAGRPGRDL